MARLTETDGLTDVQRDIIGTVREFVDTEILPVATELDHADEYPHQIVAGLKRLGVFGLCIAEEYGGLGESLLTYALAVEEISRGWMSVSGIINTHFIVAYMVLRHGTDEQKERHLPRMAAGELRGAFSMRNAVRLRCGLAAPSSVRASSATRLADAPLVSHIFWPFST